MNYVCCVTLNVIKGGKYSFIIITVEHNMSMVEILL